MHGAGKPVTGGRPGGAAAASEDAELVAALDGLVEATPPGLLRPRRGKPVSELLVASDPAFAFQMTTGVTVGSFCNPRSGVPEAPWSDAAGPTLGSSLFFSQSASARSSRSGSLAWTASSSTSWRTPLDTPSGSPLGTPSGTPSGTPLGTPAPSPMPSPRPTPASTPGSSPLAASSRPSRSLQPDAQPSMTPALQRLRPSPRGGADAASLAVRPGQGAGGRRAPGAASSGSASSAASSPPGKPTPPPTPKAAERAAQGQH
jgi:hypothetical protein